MSCVRINPSATTFLKEKAFIITFIIDIIICQARFLWKKPQLVDEFLSSLFLSEMGWNTKIKRSYTSEGTENAKIYSIESELLATKMASFLVRISIDLICKRLILILTYCHIDFFPGTTYPVAQYQFLVTFASS